MEFRSFYELLDADFGKFNMEWLLPFIDAAITRRAARRANMRACTPQTEPARWKI